MHTRVLIPIASMASAAVAQQITPMPPATTCAYRVVTSCHCHVRGPELLCMDGTTEYSMQTTPTVTVTVTMGLPASFTGCHRHGSSLVCIGPNGDHQVGAYAATLPPPPPPSLTLDQDDDHDHDHDHNHSQRSSREIVSDDRKSDCHSHAGSQHCATEGDQVGARKCKAPKRNYNIRLRVGLLFVILATSALGVFGPIFVQKATVSRTMSMTFTFVKQLGTGIVVATSFLYTHASLMFANECLGGLGYEATTSVIVMAGLVLSFIVDYAGHRIVGAKEKSVVHLSMEERAKATWSTETVTILVLEVGVLFHSLLIGLTLVVAADDDFVTLFVVILFHQVFEGLALGTRIATIGTKRDVDGHRRRVQVDYEMSTARIKSSCSGTAAPLTRPTSSWVQDLGRQADDVGQGLSLGKKLSLASVFAFITPVGMAIGIGVLQQHFNGNDGSTIVAIGTLNALSAGILMWVGVVEMWAVDWLMGSDGQQAELAEANAMTVVVAGVGLVGGLVVMSVLGKWA